MYVIYNNKVIEILSSGEYRLLPVVGADNVKNADTARYFVEGRFMTEDGHLTIDKDDHVSCWLTAEAAYQYLYRSVIVHDEQWHPISYHDTNGVLVKDTYDDDGMIAVSTTLKRKLNDAGDKEMWYKCGPHKAFDTEGNLIIDVVYFESDDLSEELQNLALKKIEV